MISFTIILTLIVQQFNNSKRIPAIPKLIIIRIYYTWLFKQDKNNGTL